MFTNVSHNYNEKNDTWTFRANFGIGFKGYIENYVMGKKKSDQLFRSISFSEITIDSFFLLELSVMIRMILDGQTKYSSWVNHKSLKSLLDVILKETWLNPDEYNRLSKFELNIKRMNEYMAVSPMDFQMNLYSKYEEVKNILGYNGMLADAATGVGKASPLDSLILTPNGWMLMGDAKIGKEIIAADGSTAKITGVYPQGVLDIYKIRFADDRVAECCIDHLWKVYEDKNSDAEGEVLRTETIINRLRNGPDLYIDLFNDKENKDTIKKELFSFLKINNLEQNSITINKKDYEEHEIKWIKNKTYSCGGKVFFNKDTIIIDFINDKIKILDIKKSRVAEAQCISIDHPSRLYVTNDYIVTHNTYMGLSISEAIESDFVVMITMKANMETVWLDTLINSSKKEYFFKKPISREEVYLSTDAYKNKSYEGQKYILFNYEAIDKLLVVLPYIRHKKTTILVDEAHNFTSLNSNRKNNLVRFCKESNSKDILLLSGTPVKATSLDIMPYLELIDPKFNPVVAARFKKLYSSPNHILKTCVPIRYGTMSVKIEKEVLNLAPIEYSTVVVNLKDGDKYTLNNIKTDMQNYITFRIKELEDNILHFKDMYNKLLDKAKASLNIPAKAWIDYENNFKLVNDYYQKRQLMFHTDLIKNVNEFEKAIILPVLKGEEKQNFREAAVVLKYPMLKVRGEVLGKVVLGARIECHKEMAKVLNYEILNSTSAKSIIMSSYIDVCEAAYDATKKAGFDPIKVYGDETKNQTANISKFIEDEKTDPAIGTYKSISTGHHLVVADLVLLMDVPFRTYILDQSIARVYRMGQKNIVHILYTKLDTGEDYNINSRNIDILKWAKDAVEEITGNTIKGLDFDKGKEIANDIAAGLENDVKGDWEHTQSAVLLSSNFMDWLAGLEDNNNTIENEDIKENSGLLSDRCIPKEKSHINW